MSLLLAVLVFAASLSVSNPPSTVSTLTGTPLDQASVPSDGVPSLAVLTSTGEGASRLVAASTPALPGPLLGGWATYYRDPKQPADARYAAAGPLLQAVLGDFRGKLIRVTAGDKATVVRVIDVCACGDRRGKPTVVDLSPAAFSDLAPLDSGIVAVEIEPVTIRPPDTSTAP